MFRRHAVKCLRLRTRRQDEPLRRLIVHFVHVDLYFFIDVDMVMLNVGVNSTAYRIPRTAHRASSRIGTGCCARGSRMIRQIEHDRMPMMACLAVDDPRSIKRSDFVWLGLVTGAGSRVENSSPPDGEQRLCHDRCCFEGFLRFSHRHGFHEVAELAQSRTHVPHVRHPP